MNSYDQYGNYIRELTPNELKIYIPKLKQKCRFDMFQKLTIIMCISTIFVISLFVQAPAIISIMIGVICSIFLIPTIVINFQNYFNISKNNIGVITLHPDDIIRSKTTNGRGQATTNMCCIVLRPNGIEKPVYYKINLDEYKRLTHNNVNEINFVFINPQKLQYVDNGGYINFVNVGVIML